MIQEWDNNLDLPEEGQIVFVEGGVAQYRDGIFYTGMETPLFKRPIQWEVTWWLPTRMELILKDMEIWYPIYKERHNSF